MKLKTNTLLLAIAALLIAGGAIFWETQQRNQAEAPSPTTETTSLFGFKEDDVTQLEVMPEAGMTLLFERTQASFPNTWKMSKPKNAIADEAAIAFLLDQLASGRRKNSVAVEKENWSDFGIAESNPQAQVTLTDGSTHRLILGGETFDKQNLYALIDPPQPLPESVQVSIVSTTLLDAINRPKSDWEYDPKDLPRVPNGESAPNLKPTQTPNSPKPVPKN